MKPKWANAFKITKGEKISTEDEAWLSSIALKINARKMGDISAFLLESTVPLHNLGANVIQFFQPILGPVLDRNEIERFARLLENPMAVSGFVDMLNAKTESLNGKHGS